jgi:ABC-type lipoprotein release transport system permease subunit
MLELRLAWRNVWRNPRRTALTVAATVFAVVLVVFAVAMAAGTHEKMIEDSVRVNAGHVQISGPEYLEKQSLEQFVRLEEGLLARIEATGGVAGAAPRVVSFGCFVAAGPAREIVLGTRLAKILRAEIGDEVLLYSMAYSLETAYELFTVVGVMKLPEAEMDRSLAVVSLEAAQTFFVYGDRVSEVAILAADADQVEPIAAALGGTVGDQPVEIHTWRESMPELEQMIVLDDAGMYVMLAILVVVVGFGILNTILMAVLERKKEFGVVLALGARPRSVFRIVYLESLMLASVGLVIGLVIGLPLVLWFQAHPVPLTGTATDAMELFGIEPVMTWKLKPLNPIGSALTILGVAIVAALYPALKASRGRPVDVLRSL